MIIVILIKAQLTVNNLVSLIFTFVSSNGDLLE